MRSYQDQLESFNGDHDVESPAPGKRSLTEGLRRAAVQRKAGPERATSGDGERAAPAATVDPFWFATGPVQARGDLGGDQVSAIAGAGVAGAAAALPHHDAIQQSFGRHDLGAVRAQVGGEAGDAARAIGASAYATGDRIAFADAPDLHTAAHEAAHVVQQRAGVHLKGGVGEVGDPYEQHADRVADRVVQGQSAEAELDAGPASGGAASGAAVQRKLHFRAGTEYLDIDGAGAGIAIPGYRATMEEARDMNPPIVVIAQQPKQGVACYTPDTGAPELEGSISIAPLAPKDVQGQTQEYNNRLIGMAHETRHGIDDLKRVVKYRGNSDAAKDGRIRTEWRAFATQSAVAYQLNQRGQKVDDRYLQDMACYASKAAFTHPKSRMLETTASYLMLYGLTKDYSLPAAAKFMQDHDEWVDEAIELFRSLFPQQLDEPVARDLRPSGVSESDWTSTVITGSVVVAGVVLAALARYFGYL